jgi:hypothetical protein
VICGTALADHQGLPGEKATDFPAPRRQLETGLIVRVDVPDADAGWRAAAIAM